jgi:hypothetical protein
MDIQASVIRGVEEKSESDRMHDFFITESKVFKNSLSFFPIKKSIIIK